MMNKAVSPATTRRRDIYRDDTDGIRSELKRLQGVRRSEIEALRAVVAPVYATRVARAAAGAILIGGATMLATIALVAALHHPNDAPGLLTAVLLATWPAAGLVFGIARIRARRRFDDRMMAILEPSDDLHMDLARARRIDVRMRAQRLIAAAEPESVALPLAGFMLLLPLTLHCLVALLLGSKVARFDDYIGISLLLVGHCHMVLAGLAWQHGRRLVTHSDAMLQHQRYSVGWKAYGITIGSSLFPGLLLLGVPVFLVAITGLFIPLAFALASTRIVRERTAVRAVLTPALPAAPQHPTMRG